MTGVITCGSNRDILSDIFHGTHRRNPTEMTYLVMGRGGPTGKTWLVDQLTNAGYRAIDIAEGAFEFIISRQTKGNYMKIDTKNKIVYISLNEPVGCKGVTE